MRSQLQLLQHIDKTKDCSKMFQCYLDKRIINKPRVLICNNKCKSKFCESCNRTRILSIKKKFKHSIIDYNYYFLTLTLRVKNNDNFKNTVLINKYWNKFTDRMRIKGFKFEYFKVLEFTKQNTPHIHAIISRHIPRWIIEQEWKSITGSHICEITKALHFGGVLNYLTSYLTKTSNKIHNELYYRFNRKHYTVSKNFFGKFSKLKIWNYIGYTCDTLAEALELSIKVFSRAVKADITTLPTELILNVKPDDW